MEDEEEDRAERVLNRRRQRATPEENHAMGLPDNITQLVVRHRWNISATDVLAQVREEMGLTDDMIDIVGLDVLEMNVDIFTIGDICRRRTELGLTSGSCRGC